MRVLVCIVFHEMDSIYLPNIEILDNYMKKTGNIIEYAGISSSDDFSKFKEVIQFKYKLICTDKQLTKLCKFIDKFRSSFDYDWYIKIRPDIRLLEPINFSILNPEAINARTRQYEGPKRIKYGTSLHPNMLRAIQFVYNSIEKRVILDDQLFMFHHSVINKFNVTLVPSSKEIEWDHTAYWKLLKIPSNIIGINVLLTKYGWLSGDLIPKRILLFGLQK